MKRERTYPIVLRFETQLYAYQFWWKKENYLSIDAVQISQPENCFYGQLKNQTEKTEDAIKNVFLHLQQILSMTHSSKKDYISATVSIIDTSKELNRFEYKLKVKLFNKQNVEIIIPLIFRLKQPFLIHKQNKACIEMKQQLQICYLTSQESTVGDYTKYGESQSCKQKVQMNKMKKKIQKLITKDAKDRRNRRKQRKLLSLKRADLRQVSRLQKMFQQVIIK